VGKVLLDITMSLDGFIAGHNDDVERRMIGPDIAVLFFDPASRYAKEALTLAFAISYNL
jgi:hypothetical protein